MMLHKLNSKLISILDKTPIGLFDGKMGYCIYFYILGRYFKNNKYTNVAEKLLDEIYDKAGSVTSLDIKSGLTGLGLAIRYLIKNKYVTGNLNFILRDIDDIIFKNLSYLKYTDSIDTLTLIHILYYLTLRLKDQRRESEEEYLYQELILTVNNLYRRIDSSFFDEPLFYTIDYKLPLLLFVLSDIYKLDFYNYRIFKILQELSHRVFAIYPTLNSNRLYMIWGLNSISEAIDSEQWKTHTVLLFNNLNFQSILNEELKDKSIFFQDGISSIYFLVLGALGYNIYRASVPLFHLTHPRGMNSEFQSFLSAQISSRERSMIENSSMKEIENYVQNQMLKRL